MATMMRFLRLSSSKEEDEGRGLGASFRRRLSIRSRKKLREKRQRHLSEPFPNPEVLSGFRESLLSRNSIDINTDEGGRNNNANWLSPPFNRNDSVSSSSNSYEDTVSDRTSLNSIDSMSCSSSCDIPITLATPPKPPRQNIRKHFVCQNPDCGKVDYLLGKLQILFLSCPYCFTHYCSVKCQLENRNDHLKVCYLGQIEECLDKIEKRLEQERQLNIHFADIAWSNYSDKGRGCMFIVFRSPLALKDFVDTELDAIGQGKGKVKFRPSFCTHMELMKKTCKSTHQSQIIEAVGKYNPCSEMLLNCAVMLNKKVPSVPAPRIVDTCIRRLLLLPLKEKKEVQRDFCSEFLSVNSLLKVTKNSRRRKSF